MILLVIGPSARPGLLLSLMLLAAAVAGFGTAGRAQAAAACTVTLPSSASFGTISSEAMSASTAIPFTMKCTGLSSGTSALVCIAPMSSDPSVTLSDTRNGRSWSYPAFTMASGQMTYGVVYATLTGTIPLPDGPFGIAVGAQATEFSGSTPTCSQGVLLGGTPIGVSVANSSIALNATVTPTCSITADDITVTASSNGSGPVQGSTGLIVNCGLGSLTFTSQNAAVGYPSQVVRVGGTESVRYSIFPNSMGVSGNQFFVVSVTFNQADIAKAPPGTYRDSVIITVTP